MPLTLYKEMMFSNKACQVPGICCVVCSWLKGQIEQGREVLEMSGNGTDIFMAYVSTFLPHSAPGVCSELTRDKVLRGCAPWQLRASCLKKVTSGSTV